MKLQKGYTLNELLLGIVALAVIGLAGFFVYAAIHFVIKFW